MYDLNGLSLNTLIHVSQHAKLVDKCRITEWVVVLQIGDDELVMNHANAHVFLQGLIRGSNRRELLSGRAKEMRIDDVPLPRKSGERRIIIG